MDKNIHFKEDTTKPENRVNLTLFHLLMIDEINNFVKSRLKIPLDSIIRPSPNLTTEEFDLSGRPDFEINHKNNIIGYIEVELGDEDTAQISNYKKSGKHIYSIVGKKRYGAGDLALDEIYEFTSNVKNKYLYTQKANSIQLFSNLIEYYVIGGYFDNAYKSKPLSDKMKSSKLVSFIFDYFGNDRILENEKTERGKIMFNTKADSGFSLRVYSREATGKSFSLMNQTGGRPFIYFPSSKKLEKYLPDKVNLINEYVNLISSLGATDITRIGETEKTSLSYDTVFNNANNFCRIIEKLM